MTPKDISGGPFSEGEVGLNKRPDPENCGLCRTTFVRCGNCKKQYEVPVEQPFRYHAVQQHKFACPAGAKETVEAQHAQLVAEFDAQQRARVKRPWWKFWRRS
jgi:hypothetical protein